MTIDKVQSSESGYPSFLHNIAHPPEVLYYIGDLPGILQMPRLAVVGARKVTPYGRAVTSRLTSEAAANGIAIVSGLALGIDGIAHQAALDAGGKTLAVMPAGLDDIYPKTHRQLATRILEQGGALISEYPSGMRPLLHHFVARNRIVSAISDAILITEASLKSGSIHTANFGLEQGKTVMCTPGNITSSLSEGTNNLIKAGAIPVTGVDDILLAMGIAPKQQQQLPLGANDQEAILLGLIQQGTSDTNHLLERSKLQATVFNQTLSMLEITGKIRPTGAGNWALR